MLYRLFELENIKYVISVDDCFADTNEKELRDELFVSAMVSFDVIKALMCDFEKSDKVEEIEELQELGMDHSQLVQELIDSLTIEQVKQAYDYISECDTYLRSFDIKVLHKKWCMDQSWVEHLFHDPLDNEPLAA